MTSIILIYIDDPITILHKNSTKKQFNYSESKKNRQSGW